MGQNFLYVSKSNAIKPGDWVRIRTGLGNSTDLTRELSSGRSYYSPVTDGVVRCAGSACASSCRRS
jgi:hypothetical protein